MDEDCHAKNVSFVRACLNGKRATCVKPALDWLQRAADGRRADRNRVSDRCVSAADGNRYGDSYSVSLTDGHETGSAASTDGDATTRASTSGRRATGLWAVDPRQLEPAVAVGISRSPLTLRHTYDQRQTGSTHARWQLLRAL